MGRYRVFVRGIDAGGVPRNWSAPTEFYVTPAPTIIGPLNATFDRTPTFQWTAVTGAGQYEIVVRQPRLGTQVFKTFVATNSFTAPVAMADDTYRWQVRAIGTLGHSSVWTTPATIIHVGGRSTLLTPSGAGNDTTPTFTWGAVDGAATYQLFVTRIDVVTPGIINVTGIVGTSYTPMAALPLGTYRAWVRAISTTSEIGPWSYRVDFTIASADEPLNGSSLDAAVLTSLIHSDLRGLKAIPPTVPVEQPARTIHAPIAVADNATTQASQAKIVIPGAKPVHSIQNPTAARFGPVPFEIVGKLVGSNSHDAVIDAVMAEFLVGDLSVLNM